MGAATNHEIAWAARALRSAAGDLGVTVPIDYSQAVAADGLARSAELAVTRLGAGVVIHTAPASNRLPIVVGYADARGQWYRDGRRHQPAAAPAGVEPIETEVGI